MAVRRRDRLERGGGPAPRRDPHIVLSTEVARLPADAALEHALLPLLRNLGRGSGAGYAALWWPDPPGEASGPTWSAAVTWPVGGGTPGQVHPAPAADPSALQYRAGVGAVAGVDDGGQRHGLLVLGVPSSGRVTGADRGLLADTATCVALLLRGARLRDELRTGTVRADRVAAEVRRTREQLAAARDVERRRLASAIVTVTTRQLADIRQRVRDLSDTVAQDPDRAEVAVHRVGDAVDDVIGHFRTVARGVYPAVLRDRGPLAALQEFAADLTRTVRFTGGFGRRTGWEVESGLYQAATATLQVLTATAYTEPLHVRLARLGNRLAVRVEEQAPGPVSATLRRALSDDGQRIAALGGELRVEVSGLGTAVELWLPDRWDVPADGDNPSPPGGDPAPGARRTGGGTLPGRATGGSQAAPAGDGAAATSLVADLRALVAAAAAPGDVTRTRLLAAVAARLDEPPRVLLVGAGADTLAGALVGEQVAVGGECAVPVWFVSGPGRHLTVHPLSGPPQRRPIVLAGDAGGTQPALHPALHPNGLDRLVVEFPAPVLRELTLIRHPDQPGAGLARELRTVDGSPVGAVDAVVLMLPGYPRPADLDFLSALRDPTVGGPRPLVVCVLPRALPPARGEMSEGDPARAPVGFPRLDGQRRHDHGLSVPGEPGRLVSDRGPGGSRSKAVGTRSIVSESERSTGSNDPTEVVNDLLEVREASVPGSLSEVCDAVVRVAAPLARAAATLRDEEFRLLGWLAEQPQWRPDRVGKAPPEPRSGLTAGPRPEQWAMLCDRFGEDGVRLAVRAVRVGRAADAAALGDHLEAVSGVARLREVLSTRLTARAESLAARWALRGLAEALRGEQAQTGPLARELERVSASAHEVRELDLLQALEAGTVGLPGSSHAPMHLLGATGRRPHARLGLPADATDTQIRRGARQALAHWRRQAQRVAMDGPARDACAALVRTCEGLLAVVAHPNHSARRQRRPDCAGPGPPPR